MTQIIDEQGRIRRSPGALAALLEQVEGDLGSQIRSIAVEDQTWSASEGIHLTGIWRATKTPILIKLGINLNQLYWTQQMAVTAPDLVPLLYAAGEQLGRLQLGWTVMERVPFNALGPNWAGNEFGMVLAAAVRFQRAARLIEPRHIARMDISLLRRWLAVGVAAEPPGPVAIIMERLEADWAWMASTCAFEVCHGDVHMCNALTRTPPPQPSKALLIDCQPIIQPWAFDAAYLQVLNSIDRDRVGYRALVPQMARIRSAYNMPTCAGDDLAKVARLTLAWFAIRLWGLTPQRHTIADYRAETERYICAGADEALDAGCS